VDLNAPNGLFAFAHEWPTGEGSSLFAEDAIGRIDMILELGWNVEA